MTDPCRPRYHYSSDNWMNDVIPFHDGERLHVYFDHNPRAAEWTRFRWGHATTTDLIDWQHQPVALTPQKDGPDAMGCWTGCIVETDDGYLAAYTGIPTFAPFTQVQCVARSKDLEVWDQAPAAVIDGIPDGWGPCFRDPHVWQQADGTWRMLVGAQQGETAAVLVYGSADLEQWELIGPFFVDGTGAFGHMGECPELFELGGKAVLAMSCGQTRGVAGVIDGDRFVATGPVKEFDPAQSYAAKSFALGDRRVQFAWVRDTRDIPLRTEAGWSGALSLPRDLTIDEDGTLRVLPSPEIDGLRGAVLFDGRFGMGSKPAFVDGVTSLTYEALVTLPRTVGTTTVFVGCEPDGTGGTPVTVDWTAGAIAGHNVGSLGDQVQLRIFADQSITEIFGVDTVITLRNYDLASQPRLALTGTGDATLTVWDIAPGSWA